MTSSSSHFVKERGELLKLLQHVVTTCQRIMVKILLFSLMDMMSSYSEKLQKDSLIADMLAGMRSLV